VRRWFLDNPDLGCLVEMGLMKGRPDQPFDEAGEPLPMPGDRRRFSRGRADLFFWIDPATCEDAVVVETKYTDWDALAQRNRVHPNLARHDRQIWSYLNGSVDSLVD